MKSHLLKAGHSINYNDFFHLSGSHFMKGLIKVNNSGIINLPKNLTEKVKWNDGDTVIITMFEELNKYINNQFIEIEKYQDL